MNAYVPREYREINVRDIKTERNQIEARIAAYERALSAIAELPFVTEETPWTWKDISTEQTKIARIALEDGIYQEVDA